MRAAGWLRCVPLRADARRLLAASWLASLSVTFSGPVCAEPAPAMGASPPAPADDVKALARRHFQRGIELANENAFKEALIEFSRAYELSPHYSVLYNIGQAHVALGHAALAVDTLKRYLAEGGANIPLDRRQAVEAEMIRQFERTATLDVHVDVPNAAVSVDGEPRGRTPLAEPVRVDIGAHRVVVTLDSGEQREQTVTVAGEEKQRVDFQLRQGFESPPGELPLGNLVVSCSQTNVQVSVDAQPIGSTPLAGPLVLASGTHRIRFSTASGVNDERAIEVPARGQAHIDCNWGPGSPSAAPTRRPGHSALGWALGAIGVGLGGAALGHLFWNQTRFHDWQGKYAHYFDDPTPGNRDAANQLAQSISRASVVTVGLTIGAGLALGTGTLLLITDSGSTAADGQHAARPTLTFRGVF
jgi:hypothetical protein